MARKASPRGEAAKQSRRKSFAKWTERENCCSYNYCGRVLGAQTLFSYIL
jgi:hypothetical protein